MITGYPAFLFCIQIFSYEADPSTDYPQAEWCEELHSNQDLADLGLDIAMTAYDEYRASSSVEDRTLRLILVPCDSRAETP